MAEYLDRNKLSFSAALLVLSGEVVDSGVDGSKMATVSATLVVWDGEVADGSLEGDKLAAVSEPRLVWGWDVVDSSRIHVNALNISKIGLGEGNGLSCLGITWITLLWNSAK